MSKPFLSVIIPAFNEERYLPKLLGDLVKQQHADFDVIAVDGGSDDKTVSAAKKFTKKMPFTIIETNLRNVSRQRNLGAEKANGEYLLFLDADVRLPEDFIAMLVEEIRKKHPDFGTTHVMVESDNVYDQIMKTFINIGADLSALINQPFVGGWNFLIKRDIFLKHSGFREDVVHGEDAELSLRLAKIGYKMTVIWKIKLYYSLRRFHQVGRLKSLSKNARAAIYTVFNGPITKNIFDYPMGGGWYSESVKNKNNSLFIRKAKKFMKKFKKLME